MNLDEAFKVAIARFDFDGLPWSPKDTIIKEVFEAGWLGHVEALKQTQMFEAKPTVTTQEAYPAATIYLEYPRKIGKGSALAAIEKALRNLNKSPHPAVPPYDFLLARTKAYAAAVALWPQDEKKFIPHPATWFNRGSYDDDPREWVRGTVPVSQFYKAY